MIRSAALLTAALALAVPSTVRAAIVVESLPYHYTPDWTDIVFADTSMALSGDGSHTTLTTHPYEGVWFGYGEWYGDQPAWSPGGSAAGNHFSLSAVFSAGAADWNAYFYDRSHEAGFTFNPTGCASQNCYGQPAQAGVSFWHALGADPTQFASTFLALDLTQTHTYEFLLKNGRVSYRIDGDVVYAGLAYQVPLGAPLLVVGDGSGSTGSGVGSMTISRLAFDNAPALDTLAPVPEADTWVLLLAGLGLVGFVARHRA